MEAFGQLAGGVAHDFNNILTVVTGNNELLDMQIKDGKQRELLARSTAAAEMGARLTARLLTFARQRKLDLMVLDLNAQINDIMELMRRSIGENIVLSTVLAPSLWRVRAEPSEVENAVLNLALNARDAMPQGGNITIETRNVVVDADHRAIEAGLAPGDHVVLMVTDTGTGMAPEVLQRAVEPFFTTKPTGKGTGLGLATIHGVVREAGGAMTIDSTVGRGTTITLYFPRVAEEAKAEAEATDGAPSAAVGDKRVLIVEDNPDVRALTSSRVEALGYKIVEADNGPNAVKCLEGSQHIDLVFSDVVMAGGMSGYDLAQWVRKNRPGTKILLTSGFVDPALDTSDVPLHIKVLAKPYRLSDLSVALHAAMYE